MKLRQLKFVLPVFIFLQTSACVVSAEETYRLSRQEVAKAITASALKNEFPNKLLFESSAGEKHIGNVNYTFDRGLHADMAEVYLRYKPDYASFVAIDVETGAILNLTSFIKSGDEFDNLVMRSDYPAASVFKVVTAAAGIDLGKIDLSTVIPYNGKSTTLYKKQVLDHVDNKWTRRPTLKESFAKSVNPVFAPWCGEFIQLRDSVRLW